MANSIAGKVKDGQKVTLTQKEERKLLVQDVEQEKADYYLNKSG